MKPATLKDVARAAGVSIWTVSNTFSGKAPVTQSTKTRVLEAAKTLRYIPNQTARALRRETHGPIVVMTASTSNAYYVDMLDGIHEMLRTSSHGVRTADLAPEGRFDQKTEDLVVIEAIQSRAAGVISTLTLSVDNHEKLCEWGIPIVYVDSQGPTAPSGSVSVTSNNEQAAYQIGEHLNYHRLDKWLLLIYPERWSTRQTRIKGMENAAEKFGATLSILECANDSQSSATVLEEYLRDRKTEGLAVIAGNNPLLLGTMHALQACDLHVPDQVALVAFDEFTWSTFVDPPVTLIDEDSRDIGAKAALKLIHIMQEHPQGAIRYHNQESAEVNVKLRIRGSCGC